jgi:uncharacterized membrane protein
MLYQPLIDRIDRVPRGVVVKTATGWIAFAKKSGSADFRTEHCVGEHDGCMPDTFAKLFADLPASGTITWWSWLQQPNSTRFYPVKFTYTAPEAAMNLSNVQFAQANPKPAMLTWTNFDFSSGVCGVMVHPTTTPPAATPGAAARRPYLPSEWTTLVVRLRRGQAVLTQVSGNWLDNTTADPKLEGELENIRSRWSYSLDVVKYVQNRDTHRPPQVASDSGQPTTLLAIAAEVAVNAIIGVIAWVAWCEVDSSGNFQTTEGKWLFSAALATTVWFLVRAILLFGMRYSSGMPCKRLAEGGLILYLVAVVFNALVTTLVAVSLALQRPAENRNNGVVLTSILLGLSALYTLYNFFSSCCQQTKLARPVDDQTDGDSDDDHEGGRPRFGLGSCTEIVFGVFSLIAFGLCTSSLVLVFVSLEQGGLTIPAFTNLAHEVVAHHNEFTG